jgi:hypothetical protein
MASYSANVLGGALAKTRVRFKGTEDPNHVVLATSQENQVSKRAKQVALDYKD